jgi:hypothetical protein
MYEKHPNRSYEDLRSEIDPKTDYTLRTNYQAVPYPQVFGKNFDANLSIIDLLSCEGPNALSVLRRSATV